jgi:hypothetical protein
VEQVTVIRKTLGSVDQYGEPTVTETEVTLNAYVSQRLTGNGTIYNPDANILSDGLTLYVPTNTEVRANDEFVVRGLRYQLEGDAFDWKNGITSWTPGGVINLSRLEHA